MKKAFNSGDNDSDNTLSVSEAVSAVESLSGKSLENSTVSLAASAAGVDTSREMDCEFYSRRACTLHAGVHRRCTFAGHKADARRYCR